MDEWDQPSGFGPFRCGGVEILRRIFVTVRDRNWKEIAPSRWDCEVNEMAHITAVQARHVSDLVDFEWRGTLKGSANGRSLQFAFDGEARRTMDICRLGLVVLHPVEAMRGARVHVLAPPEARQKLIVSSAIAPQPVVDGIPLAMTRSFSSLSIERADFGLLELKFDGDLFEIEDQRNWGDASFKTYCTPLRLGYPRRINMGSRIAHRLDLRYAPPPVVARVNSGQTPRRTMSGLFPTIGRRLLEPGTSASSELAWHHVQVNLRDVGDAEELLRKIEAISARCLEIGVEDRCLADQAPSLVSWIADNRRRVARVLVYGAGASPPCVSSIASWRRILGEAGAANLPMFAATKGYFVEFNRATERQPVYPIGISFPLTGTVHADDAITIAENVATIRDIADTARLLTQSRDFVIAPLALHYPPSRGSPRFPPAMVAPWLAAMMIHAASAGVGSITLADDLASAVPTPLVAHLLECAGLTVTLLEGQPKGVHAALLSQSSRGLAQLLGINLTDAPGQLNLHSLAPRIRSLTDIRDRQEKVDTAQVDIAAFGVRWLKCDLN